MRKILFRGKNTESGEWWYGDLFHTTKRVFIRRPLKGDLSEPHTYYEHDSVIPDTVGQYTGLRDSKRTAEYPEGQMIFEGDIVEGLFRFHRPVNSVVAYSEGSFGLLWDRGGVETFWAFPTIRNVEYEVIGNIHDNPELLKGGEG